MLKVNYFQKWPDKWRPRGSYPVHVPFKVSSCSNFYVVDILLLGSQADAALYQVGYPDYLWNDNKFSERYKMVILNKLINVAE